MYVSQKYPAWQELTQLKVTQYIPSQNDKKKCKYILMFLRNIQHDKS